MGKDSSVLEKRCGNFVHPLVSWQKQDVVEVGDLVKDNLHKNHITDVAAIYCDGTVVGAGTSPYITRQYNLPAVKVTGYFSNLINREELNGYWREGQLLATGECRRFDEYQTEYVDLGFIVNQSERGKGLGTKIFKYLVALAEEKELKPICSTEKTNLGAQKAISRAGLFAGNRIIKFDK